MTTSQPKTKPKPPESVDANAAFKKFLEAPVDVDLTKFDMGTIQLKRPSAEACNKLRQTLLSPQGDDEEPKDVSQRNLDAAVEVLSNSTDTSPDVARGVLIMTGAEGSPLFDAIAGFAGIEFSKDRALAGDDHLPSRSPEQRAAG